MAGWSLDFLVGYTLDSVEFVQNYLRLRIFTDCLTITTRTRLHVGEKIYEWGDKDYRNILCDQIGTEIVATEDQPNSVFLEFESGTKIEMSLRLEDFTKGCAEAILVAGVDGTTISFDGPHPSFPENET